MKKTQNERKKRAKCLDEAPEVTLAAGDLAAARAQAAHAQRCREALGDYWGSVDAAEVLAALN